MTWKYIQNKRSKDAKRMAMDKKQWTRFVYGANWHKQLHQSVERLYEYYLLKKIKEDFKNLETTKKSSIRKFN